MVPLDEMSGLAPLEETSGLVPLHEGTGLTQADSLGLTSIEDDPLASPNPLGNLPEPAIGGYADPLANQPGTGALAMASANPYRSPTLFSTQALGSTRRSDGEFGFVSVLTSTWYTFWENWVTCLLIPLAVATIIILVGVVLAVGITVVGLILRSTADEYVPLALLVVIAMAIVAYFALAVLLCWLFAGLTQLTTRIAKGETHSINDIFLGGPHTLRMFGFLFLQNLVTHGLGLAVGIPLIFIDSLFVHVIFRLVAVVISLFVVLTWFLCPYLIVDRGNGIIEAMRESAEYMSGKRLVALAINLVVVLGMSLFTVATVGLGFLLAWPFMLLSMAVTYVKATGQRTAY